MTSIVAPGAQGCVGIMGGLGFENGIDWLDDAHKVSLVTPFGPPSDEYLVGTYQGIKVVFLNRHASGHRILPHEINNRANIWGFHRLGTTWLLSNSAVGSLRAEIKPSQLVVPGQFFDRTTGRISTFFGGGVVGHIQFGDPVCFDLSGLVTSEAKLIMGEGKVHGLDADGHEPTLVVINGPAFSTKAESRLYRQWGMDVVGMTTLPESKLAREAGICYVSLGWSTDYDSWKEDEEQVSVEVVGRVINQNVGNAMTIFKRMITLLGSIQTRSCSCHGAGRRAIQTQADCLPQLKEGETHPLDFILRQR